MKKILCLFAVVLVCALALTAAGCKTGGGGDQIPQISADLQVLPGKTGGQTVGTLHQEGDPALGNVDGVGHVVDGGAQTGSQTAQAGAHQNAAEGAENVAQMDGRGAHQIGGDGNADRRADGSQRSQKAGHGDALGGNFLIHGIASFGIGTVIIARTGYK